MSEPMTDERLAALRAQVDSMREYVAHGKMTVDRHVRQMDEALAEVLWLKKELATTRELLDVASHAVLVREYTDAPTWEHGVVLKMLDTAKSRQSSLGFANEGVAMRVAALARFMSLGMTAGFEYDIRAEPMPESLKPDAWKVVVERRPSSANISDEEGEGR